MDNIRLNKIKDRQFKRDNFHEFNVVLEYMNEHNFDDDNYMDVCA